MQKQYLYSIAWKKKKIENEKFFFQITVVYILIC